MHGKIHYIVMMAMIFKTIVIPKNALLTVYILGLVTTL